MKIFISYAREDHKIASKLYQDLKELDLEPWIDSEHLLAGQPYKSVINKEIKNSTYFFALLSSKSVSKKGFVQKELKTALDLLGESPQSDIYLIPIRLEDCEIHDDKLYDIHRVDLFPLYYEGVKKLLKTLKTDLTENQKLEIENKILAEKLSKAEDENQRLKSEKIKNNLQSVFWDSISDSILIVFGAESIKGDFENSYTKISLRDLDAATIILTFLAENYPQKRVKIMPSNVLGWDNILNYNKKTDLIIIGGFVNNREFGRHNFNYKTKYNLKLSRICYCGNKQNRKVVHVNMDNYPYHDKPMISEPEKIARISSIYVKYDFGCVLSTRDIIYGSSRRMISIAGIKGNGTRGAAIHLTQIESLNKEISSYLKGKNLSSDDSLEMLIKTDVIYKEEEKSDKVDKTELIEIVLNNEKPLHYSSSAVWKECEFSHECENCDFGVTTYSKSISNAKAIIFDLDDTLIDTFNMLIDPLEKEAARKMSEVDNSLQQDSLYEKLLELRMSCPERLEEEISKIIPDNKKTDVIQARKEVFINPQLEQRLFLNSSVREYLSVLKDKIDMYLMTEGDKDFQNKKINHIGIKDLFKKVIVLTEKTKEDAIKEVVAETKYNKEAILVVGNRLDKEIISAKNLDLPSVWIRHGEGCKMAIKDKPTFIFDNIIDFLCLISNN